jgi:hypothetical protein
MSDETAPAWEDMGYGAMPPELANDLETPGHARAREPRHAHGPTYSPPVFATEAKCQAHPAGCKAIVAVTEEAMGSFATFNRQLVKRGEQPLDLDACFPCATCRAKREAAAGDKSATRRTKNTEAIRFLKASDPMPTEEAMENLRANRVGPHLPPCTSDKVTTLMERLGWLTKTMGGGYVADLLTAIRDARKAPAKSKPRTGDL